MRNEIVVNNFEFVYHYNTESNSKIDIISV